MFTFGKTLSRLEIFNDGVGLKLKTKWVGYLRILFAELSNKFCLLTEMNLSVQYMKSF